MPPPWRPILHYGWYLWGASEPGGVDHAWKLSRENGTMAETLCGLKDRYVDDHKAMDLYHGERPCRHCRRMSATNDRVPAWERRTDEPEVRECSPSRIQLLLGAE